MYGFRGNWSLESDLAGLRGGEYRPDFFAGSFQCFSVFDGVVDGGLTFPVLYGR